MDYIQKNMIIAEDFYDMNQFYDELLVQYLEENFPGICLSMDQLVKFFLDLFFTVHWRCHDQLSEQYAEFIDVTNKKDELAGTFVAIVYFDANDARKKGWSDEKISAWIEKHREPIRAQFFEYLEDFLVQFIQSYNFQELHQPEK